MHEYAVGFSVNPELVVEFDKRQGDEKLPLINFRVDLSGSSADVAIAINQLGGASLLLGLVGSEGDDEQTLLLAALKKRDIQFKGIHLLDRTSIAVLPIDHADGNTRVVGRRGTILPEAYADGEESVMSAVADKPRMFRVATGVRPSEIGLVRALFSNAEPGYRVLNPNLLLCSERAAVSALLAISDVLVLNKNEYHELARLFGIALVSDVHRLGPQTVVLTLDEQGGICSHKGSEMRYSAVRYAQAEEKIYPPGAGDWFLGGFVSSLPTGTLSLSVTQIHHALRFAAQVSGKKVTMPGAGNGPTLASL